jgi:uncharacterized membrane protein YhaH (DUF805 family)
MDLVIKCITEKYCILLGIDFSLDLSADTFGVFSGFFALLAISPSLAVSVRRLHDTNRVGWWVLTGVIPLVGLILVVVFCCLKGDEGENRFG